jgi:H+/Cl- antiporter ClcA
VHSWRARLPFISTLCLVLGLGCGVIAGLMGAIYRTDTLVDWQAVQVWRIEWLLGAIVVLLAGLLLQRSGR